MAEGDAGKGGIAGAASCEDILGTVSSSNAVKKKLSDVSPDVCYPFFYKGKCERMDCPFVHEKPGICYQWRGKSECDRVNCPFEHSTQKSKGKGK